MGLMSHVASLVPLKDRPFFANVREFLLENLHLLDGCLPLRIVEKGIDTVHNAGFGSQSPILRQRVRG